MEKTIEILLVATVVLMTAVIVIFMLQGRVTNFDDFLEGESEDARCDIGEVKYENLVSCEGVTLEEPSEAQEIKNKEEYSICETSNWGPDCGDSGSSQSSDSGSSESN